jgi:hypothetical protein
MRATVPSSRFARRHLASGTSRAKFGLGPDTLAYLAASLIAVSSAALNQFETFARLAPCADFIAANMPPRPTVWRIK